MKIFIITGPSGVGKTHLVNELSKHGVYPLKVYTDRERRLSESVTTDRIYLSKEEFDKGLSDFLYWFEFQGNRYGYRSSDIEEQKRAGRSICFNITPTHLRFLLEKLPEAIVIYLHTPKEDFDLLFKRMVERDISEDDSDDVREAKVRSIESRLNFALGELDKAACIEDIINKNPQSKRFLVRNDNILNEEIVPYVLSLISM